MKRFFISMLLSIFIVLPLFSQQSPLPSMSKERYEQNITNGVGVIIGLPVELNALKQGDPFYIDLTIISVQPAPQNAAGFTWTGIVSRASDGLRYSFWVEPEHTQAMRALLNKTGKFVGLRIQDELYIASQLFTSVMSLPNIAPGYIIVIIGE